MPDTTLNPIALQTNQNAATVAVVEAITLLGMIPDGLWQVQDDGAGGLKFVKPVSITVPIFANNAAAIAGGLTATRIYRTGADPDVLCVVH